MAERTPLQRNARLSGLTGADVWLKREDLQVGRSYKIRGAYNMIAELDDAERAAGVVCASAGNHGQGVAYACRALQVRGRVFVPGTTPRQKRERIAALGGDMVELVVTGDSYDDAAAAARRRSRATTGATPGARLRRPDDGRRPGDRRRGDPRAARPEPPDVVVLPVGGGGLLAGVRHLAARPTPPATRLVGVEPAGAANMAAALAAGGAGRRCPRSTPSSTAPPCAGPARSPIPLVRDSGAELLAVARGPGLHRDARPLPGRRDHRRARRRPGRPPR